MFPSWGLGTRNFRLIYKYLGKETKILNIEYKEFTLENGLKVVMSENSKIPNVAVSSTFRVGSKDEDEDKTGLAHLFEHLMFEGSKNVEKGKFDEILNSNGGESNAYTSCDVTGYYILIPSNKLELAFWLDSDRIAGFNIDEEALEIQKNVVMEEKLQVHDNTPYGTVEEESAKRLFKNCGYKRPIIGNMEHVQKFNLNDINEFFETYYIPSNMVLSVVGDIDYNETESLIRKYYDEIRNGKKIIRKGFDEEELNVQTKDIIYDDVSLTGKFYFYKIPGYGSKDYYISRLVSSILTYGDSSRLYRNLVYNRQLVNEIDSSVQGMEQISLFSINAIATEGSSPDEIEFEIDKTIDELRNGVVSDDEIIKSKNRLTTKYITKLQTNLNLANKLSFLRTFYPDCSKINSEINEYACVTKFDIINFTEKYLSKNKRVVLDYLPKEKKLNN